MVPSACVLSTSLLMAGCAARAGYRGSIDLDGGDFGPHRFSYQAAFGEVGATLGSCSWSDEDTLSLHVNVARDARSVQDGYVRITPGRGVEVQLPWSRVFLGSADCTTLAVEREPDRGTVHIDCKEPRRGDLVKVDAEFRGCSARELPAGAVRTLVGRSSS
jgi:hypothetical protein